MLKHSTAQHSTAQHSTAQHSTAQHSTAQHSTAQHSISLTVSSFCGLGNTEYNVYKTRQGESEKVCSVLFFYKEF
jgi:hypothetical protein